MTTLRPTPEPFTVLLDRDERAVPWPQAEPLPAGCTVLELASDLGSARSRCDELNRSGARAPARPALTGRQRSTLAAHRFVTDLTQGEAGQLRLSCRIPLSLCRAAWASEVGRWQAVHDDEYFNEDDSTPGDFDTSGWIDSFDGREFPADEMREWRDGIVRLLLASQPGSALEVGCGTGLLGVPLLQAGVAYTGIDNSPHAIGRLSGIASGLGLTATLLEGEALDIGDRCGEGFGLVVLNSVCQYFPDEIYLDQVLTAMISACAPGGRVFVGDVRRLDLSGVFATEQVLHRRGQAQSRGRVRADVRHLAGQRRELVLNPAYFHRLAARDHRVAGVACHLRRGRFANELTKYRFDVTIFLRDAAGETTHASLPGGQRAAAESLDEIAGALSAGPAVNRILVRDGRLSADVMRAADLGGGLPWDAVGARRDSAGPAGVMPAAACALAEDRGYQADVRVHADDPALFWLVASQAGEAARVPDPPWPPGGGATTASPAISGRLRSAMISTLARDTGLPAELMGEADFTIAVSED